MEKRRVCSLPACTYFASTSVRTYFFRNPAYTDGQLRHPASWAEQLLDSQDSHSQLPTVGLVGLQTVSDSHEFTLCVQINSINCVTLENPDSFSSLLFFFFLFHFLLGIQLIYISNAIPKVPHTWGEKSPLTIITIKLKE